MILSQEEALKRPRSIEIRLIIINVRLYYNINTKKLSLKAQNFIRNSHFTILQPYHANIYSKYHDSGMLRAKILNKN